MKSPSGSEVWEAYQPDRGARHALAPLEHLPTLHGPDESGHHRLTIDPAVDNSRTVRAYEKISFGRIGATRNYERGPDGTWHDHLLMDMLADELVRLEPTG